MQPEPSTTLAQRLRGLREGHFPEVHLTQEQLARVLGVSPPAISSWENRSKIPPVNRLGSYARLFATPRSVEEGTLRLLADDDLTEVETAERERLENELIQLREAALGPVSAVGPARALPLPTAGTAPVAGTWYFPDRAPITIVCARLPERLQKSMPYADPQSPDYIDAYTYADLDALIEIFGHIRAVNPANQVRFRRSTELVEDDYTTHLVLLGGIDWNDVTAELQDELQDQLDLPVRQLSVTTDDSWDAWFEVRSGNERVEHRPRLQQSGGREVLREDVAHFLRAPNPFNQRRTVTFCNGMYGRGVLGAVRALTDQRFRDRNEGYIDTRFGGSDIFSILMRVRMAPGGKVITPDWTKADTRLHEWPEDTS